MVVKHKPNRASKTNWLKSLLAPEPREIVVEAAYFAVGAMHEKRQLSSEASKAGRTLALHILSEIEAHEGINYTELSEQQAGAYANMLLTAVLELTRQTRPVKPGLGKRLLDKLRARG